MNVDTQTLGDLEDQETKAVAAKSSIQNSNKRKSPVLHQHQPSLTTNDAMKSNKSNTHDIISQNSRRITYSTIEKLAILTEIKLGAKMGTKTQNEIILSKRVSKSMVCRWKKQEEALKTLAEAGLEE
jgi:hypothetical protein